MAKRLMVFAFCIYLTMPSVAVAANRYFLGTRTGWERTKETFMNGRYKNYNLFLVIGARPTTRTLNDIAHWKSSNTFIGYTKDGAGYFKDQTIESAKSVPRNAKSLGESVISLFIDPAKEIKNFDLITPASVLWKTTVNISKIGWYTIKTPCEPIIRVGTGSLVMLASPFVKPAHYFFVSTLFTVTAIYGYTSSLVGGGTLMGATGAVCGMDIATSPLVATYSIFSNDRPAADAVEKPMNTEVYGE